MTPAIDPPAGSGRGHGPCRGQPRGEAGRSVLCAGRQQDRRRALHRCRDCRPARSRSRAIIRRQAIAACRSSATPNPRRALALAAAKFYPRQPATIAAVTGTSGKTSVAAFTRQIWQRLGHASASIGTIGLVSPKRTIYGSLTTPDPIALHRQLDEIARDGVTHLAFEASSHGLDQYPARRRADRRRRLHQPVARPHGLPSRRRALSRRQAAAVPRSGRRRRRRGDLGRS